MGRKRAKLAKKKISDDQRTTRRSLDPVPLDLIPEILVRLPVKTLARFICVSKHYASIIRNKDFMKSYLIKSSTRPQSLIVTFDYKSYKKRFFFSASHHHDLQDRVESSSSVATYHMKYRYQPGTTVAPSVHGLICYGPPYKLMVYNPSTRRSLTLPEIDSVRLYHYLGYDPVDGDYKVLCMTKDGRGLAQKLRVLTLGNDTCWRRIQDCPPHSPHESVDICISGVLYYEAFRDKHHQAVMSFDVRSEKFDLIKLPEEATFTKLTNYKGKLAVMSSTSSRLSTTCTIDLWVLVDAAKHEWSYKLALDLTITDRSIWCPQEAFCITDAGEFVLGPDTSFAGSPLFYVLYYDPNKNSVRKVYIDGIRESKNSLWDTATTSVFFGQVENLMFL